MYVIYLIYEHNFFHGYLRVQIFCPHPLLTQINTTFFAYHISQFFVLIQKGKSVLVIKSLIER